jgi:hypothetical protein
MNAKRLLVGVLAGVLVVGSAAGAWAAYFDVVEGLYANIPAGATGGPATQAGVDNWWYKYEPVTRFNQRGSLVERDPSTFVLMELGSDGTARPYGWAANAGYAINDRGVFRKGIVANRMVSGGTTMGDGVWANAENNVQLALEWRAPEDGTVDVFYELIGRNHANTDIEWHLATSTLADPWNDLDFIAVTQAHTPAAPAVLQAARLDLAAGESLYLYGMIYDYDDYDGTVITGGIDFTPEPTGLIIPEPGTFLVWFLLAGLGLGAAWRRKR